MDALGGFRQPFKYEPNFDNGYKNTVPLEVLFCSP